VLRQWWYITISDRSQKVEDGWDIAKNSSLAAMSCYMLFECQPCLF